MLGSLSIEGAECQLFAAALPTLKVLEFQYSAVRQIRRALWLPVNAPARGVLKRG